MDIFSSSKRKTKFQFVFIQISLVFTKQIPKKVFLIMKNDKLRFKSSPYWIINEISQVNSKVLNSSTSSNANQSSNLNTVLFSDEKFIGDINLTSNKKEPAFLKLKELDIEIMGQIQNKSLKQIDKSIGSKSKSYELLQGIKFNIARYANQVKVIDTIVIQQSGIKFTFEISVKSLDQVSVKDNSKSNSHSMIINSQEGRKLSTDLDQHDQYFGLGQEEFLKFQKLALDQYNLSSVDNIKSQQQYSSKLEIVNHLDQPKIENQQDSKEKEQLKTQVFQLNLKVNDLIKRIEFMNQDLIRRSQNELYFNEQIQTLQNTIQSILQSVKQQSQIVGQQPFKGNLSNGSQQNGTQFNEFDIQKEKERISELQPQYYQNQLPLQMQQPQQQEKQYHFQGNNMIS